MDARRLFQENLALIDRVIGRVCAKAGITGADAEDFASDVRVALLENDCAILREWEQRAALGTYLVVVVQRLLADARRRTAGKWKPSAEARRLGEAAVTLERMIRRQGRTVDEALPALRAIDPSITASDARAIAERLPERAPRPRPVQFDPELDVPSPRDDADAAVVTAEARRLSERTAAVVRQTLETMPIEDRMIVSLRFASGMTIADVARILRLPQRPLYRRIESITARLRQALRDEGIDPVAVEELIGSPHSDMDFGLRRDAVPRVPRSSSESLGLETPPRSSEEPEELRGTRKNATAVPAEETGAETRPDGQGGQRP
ncbi:MAG TPA: sigma-70 family RNA polymerase sigma factor [Thermoanaerobaculia bacterium]